MSTGKAILIKKGDFGNEVVLSDPQGLNLQRDIKWPYMVIVAGAPLAHWAVSASRAWPNRKYFWWWMAGGATVAMLANRFFWWHDAGYAGDETGKFWGELRQTEVDRMPKIGTYSKECWGKH